MDGYYSTVPENRFHKVRKIFLILLPQVVVYEFEILIFEGFELDIANNVGYRRKVGSLIPLLLTFVDLLAKVRYIVCNP
jgi:hypothetical protein